MRAPDCSSRQFDARVRTPLPRLATAWPRHERSSIICFIIEVGCCSANAVVRAEPIDVPPTMSNISCSGWPHARSSASSSTTAAVPLLPPPSTQRMRSGRWWDTGGADTPPIFTHPSREPCIEPSIERLALEPAPEDPGGADGEKGGVARRRHGRVVAPVLQAIFRSVPCFIEYGLYHACEWTEDSAELSSVVPYRDSVLQRSTQIGPRESLRCLATA